MAEESETSETDCNLVKDFEDCDDFEFLLIKKLRFFLEIG